MNDSFSALHPALTFCYFAAVLLLTMLVLHPVFLALSLLGALGYCAVLRGWRSLGRTLGWLVPFLVLMAALNALLNHAGVTMLFYLPNGNPVTREALCYGAAAAAMFAAVILWFQCCNVVMTAEKYLYVFGSALPGVSLLLSMALRFVPKFSAHIRAVRAAQASLGIRQSPRGLIEILPTLGPSGKQERLNCWLKKRRQKVCNHFLMVSSSYIPLNVRAARKNILEGRKPQRRK